MKEDQWNNVRASAPLMHEVKRHILDGDGKVGKPILIAGLVVSRAILVLDD